MKIFYSELAANPALYSFAYAVYGILESQDQIDEVYEKGFLPFVGAKEQPNPMVYAARGSRVLVEQFAERHYHSRVVRKFQSFVTEPVECIVHRREDFLITDAFVHFFLSYFQFRFGKGAMPEERLRAILNSSFVTHISEYRVAGNPVGYMLEVHGALFVHVWYQAYAKIYERRYVGLFMYIDLLRRAKAAGMKYLYFGVTYGNWMSYKTNFQPLEFWNGETWVHDTKSLKLKALLALDPFRTRVHIDSWRDTQGAYYRDTALPHTFLILAMLMLLLCIFGFYIFL